MYFVANGFSFNEGKQKRGNESSLVSRWEIVQRKADNRSLSDDLFLVVVLVVQIEGSFTVVTDGELVFTILKANANHEGEAISKYNMFPKAAFTPQTGCRHQEE